MKSQFSLNTYTDPKYAMLCETVAEARDFQNLLDGLGYTWGGGASYAEYPLTQDTLNQCCDHRGGVVFYFNRGTWDSFSSYAQLHSMEHLLVYSDFSFDVNYQMELTRDEIEKLWKIIN